MKNNSLLRKVSMRLIFALALCDCLVGGSTVYSATKSNHGCSAAGARKCARNAGRSNVSKSP